MLIGVRQTCVLLPPDRYWDDTDLMSKISAKLRTMKVDEQQADSTAANNQAGRKPGKVT